MEDNLDKKRDLTKIWYLNKKDVKDMTGWGDSTVTALFQSRDFPAITIGKTHYVTNIALEEWSKVRRDIL